MSEGQLEIPLAEISHPRYPARAGDADAGSSHSGTRAGRLVVLALLGTALLLAPRPAAASKIGELITKGYKRDLKSCQKKWKGILAQCKKAENPTLKNNCGLPKPTTTSTSTTTTSTAAPLPVCPGSTASTSSTTTTTIPTCDTPVSWAPCGASERGCTCHHVNGGASGDYVCADVGPRVRPTYTCILPCSTTQDCFDCTEDPADVCIGGASGEPPRGACVHKCE